MNNRSALTWLVPLVALLASVAASAGLIVAGGDGPSSFTTVHGQTVQLYGRGLYRHDTLFYAGTFKGLDAVTLAVFVPALAVSFWLDRRGSQRGALMLTGVLGVFLYNGASMAFSAAYNPLFLVYVALLAASFYAFVLAFVSLDHDAFAVTVSSRLPRRGLAGFLFVAGLAPLGLWLGDVLSTLAAARVPELLGSYTTTYTYAVDLAVIVPAVYLAAWLLLRRAPVAYALSAVVLILLISVGIGVVAATLAQLSLGLAFSTGQLIGLIGSWILLGATAIGFTAVLLNNLPDEGAGRPRQRRLARSRPPQPARERHSL